MNPELPPSLPSLLLPLEQHLHGTENHSNDDDEAAAATSINGDFAARGGRKSPEKPGVNPSSNRPFAKESRGPIGSHEDDDDDEDEDDDYDYIKGLNEDDAAVGEEQAAKGWTATNSKKKTKKGKKGGAGKGKGGSNMRWMSPEGFSILNNAKKDIEKQKNVPKEERKTIGKILEQVNIPRQTWYDFKKDVEGYRKKAFATEKERSDKYTTKATKKKQASGSLSKHPNAVWSRDHTRRLNLGHVPTRGPRQLKAEGEHSKNVGTQHSRACQMKKIAKNVAAAAAAAVASDMVIDEGGDF